MSWNRGSATTLPGQSVAPDRRGYGVKLQILFEIRRKFHVTLLITLSIQRQGVPGLPSFPGGARGAHAAFAGAAPGALEGVLRFWPGLTNIGIFKLAEVYLN